MDAASLRANRNMKKLYSLQNEKKKCVLNLISKEKQKKSQLIYFLKKIKMDKKKIFFKTVRREFLTLK